MIQPISFKSHYLVKGSKNKFQRNKFFQFKRYSSRIVNTMDRCNASYICEKTKNKKDPYREFVLLSVPDELDLRVERYCIGNDILYKKFSSKNP